MALPAFTFDTHKFVRKIKGAGFNDQQAEALTDAVQESQASLNVATKQDAVDVRRDVEQGFADVRRDLGTQKSGLMPSWTSSARRYAMKSAICAKIMNRCARIWTPSLRAYMLFFFNETATTEIYTLSLHDALPISTPCMRTPRRFRPCCGNRRPDFPQHRRSEEHTSELQSPDHLVCRLLLEKK